MNFETEFMQEKWSKDIDALRRDVDAFRNYFDQHKKCACPIYDCKHYKKALVKILGDRIHNLSQTSIDIGVKTYYDVMKR